MRLIMGAVAALALVAGATLAIADSAPQTSGANEVCLRLRDLRNLTRVDETTLRAETRSSQSYLIKLRGACPQFGQVDNYYTIKVLSPSECFDRDDVLEFRYGGACFIDSVQPISK